MGLYDCHRHYLRRPYWKSLSSDQRCPWFFQGSGNMQNYIFSLGLNSVETLDFSMDFSTCHYNNSKPCGGCCPSQSEHVGNQVSGNILVCLMIFCRESDYFYQRCTWKILLWEIERGQVSGRVPQSACIIVNWIACNSGKPGYSQSRYIRLFLYIIKYYSVLPGKKLMYNWCTNPILMYNRNSF